MLKLNKTFSDIYIAKIIFSLYSEIGHHFIAFLGHWNISSELSHGKVIFIRLEIPHIIEECSKKAGEPEYSTAANLQVHKCW